MTESAAATYPCLLPQLQANEFHQRLLVIHQKLEPVLVARLRAFGEHLEPGNVGRPILARFLNERRPRQLRQRECTFLGSFR